MQEQPWSQPSGEQWHTPPQNLQGQPHSSFPQPGSTPYPTDAPLYPVQQQAFQPPMQQQSYPGLQQPPAQPYPYPGSQQPSAQLYPGTQQPYPYPGSQQFPAQPYPTAQPPMMSAYPSYQGVQPVNMMNTMVNVNVQQKGHGLFIRAIYFLCIGWWVGYFWLSIGFGLCMLIVTLPVGLAMLNRLPQVLTLRSPGMQTQTNVSVNTAVAGMPGTMTMAQTVNINVNVGGTQQANFLIRALYFLFIGWWAGWFWANLGYLLCVLIVTLPIGLMMLNRLPMVLTLRKN